MWSPLHRLRPRVRSGRPGPRVPLMRFVLTGAILGRPVRVVLSPGRSSVGSAADNDVRLVDPTVSRHHAELAVEEDAVGVRDLGSSNGTSVDGATVPEASTTRVAPNAVLGFGSVELTLEQVAQDDLETGIRLGRGAPGDPPEGREETRLESPAHDPPPSDLRPLDSLLLERLPPLLQAAASGCGAATAAARAGDALFDELPVRWLEISWPQRRRVVQRRGAAGGRNRRRARRSDPDRRRSRGARPGDGAGRRDRPDPRPRPAAPARRHRPLPRAAARVALAPPGGAAGAGSTEPPPGGPRDLPPGGPGRRRRGQRPRPRRVGHRQGAPGALHPPGLRPPRRAFSSPSTAPPCPATCWRPSCSASRRARRPASTSARASSSWPTRAPSSWTRSATCRRRPRRGSCG